MKKPRIKSHNPTSLEHANVLLSEQREEIARLLLRINKLEGQRETKYLSWQEKYAELKQERDIYANTLEALSEKLNIESEKTRTSDCKLSDAIISHIERYANQQALIAIAKLMEFETTVGRLHNGEKRSFIFCADVARFSEKIKP